MPQLRPSVTLVSSPVGFAACWLETMMTTGSIRAQPGRPVIERTSPTDRAFLAMDSGEIPEQFGVILLLAARCSTRMAAWTSHRPGS